MSAGAVPYRRQVVDRIGPLLDGIERTLKSANLPEVARRKLARNEARLIFSLLADADEETRARTLARLQELGFADQGRA